MLCVYACSYKCADKNNQHYSCDECVKIFYHLNFSTVLLSLLMASVRSSRQCAMQAAWSSTTYSSLLISTLRLLGCCLCICQSFDRSFICHSCFFCFFLSSKSLSHPHGNGRLSFKHNPHVWQRIIKVISLPKEATHCYQPCPRFFTCHLYTLN